ncbi:MULTISPECIES: FAD-dependent oxidoreductase [Kitasatospora]|uniref:FAD dependent oxidoreductase domain-containing protein n=1 Tax=Kitasatospora setae (strain ATCC 33774 / DSM 43861 / JCM 3304 / KCC A-0304 / NBRC 14216 / KM-6054) TaxID=452652 RepID=E4NJX9_KITSK|nr:MULTISPECIES: FAD-dependent oxidoreductase [Kitasatospora]BAJ33277.1 hypothetical protein KSE_75230 [Kitasatospora setae KM-6054]
MVHVAVAGGGIAGLAAGLFLARRGHRVTVLERDPRTAGADLDADFLHWPRPRTPQAVQPHSLLGPVRTVLRELVPDVYAAVLRDGAIEHHDLPAEPADPAGPAHPAGLPPEEFVTMRTRRIVLEAALVRALRAEPGAELRTGSAVEGLLTAGRSAVPRVTGLRTAAGEDLRADLVIDAGGRRTRLPRWLQRAGARPVRTERHPTGIAYFCRWYRARPGQSEPAGLGAAAPHALCGVFPSDNGYFAVALTVSVEDPARTALRDPDAFDAAARTFPAARDWLALDQRPTGPVHVMAGLDNRWTALVDERGPQVTGLIGIGDGAVHTNPTLGQGIPLALWAAAEIARHDDPADPGLAAAHHQWRVARLKPWYDAQVAADRMHRARFRAALRGEPLPAPAGDALLAVALAAARADPAAARARARIRHLRRTPARTLADPADRARAEEWLRAHPDFDGLPPATDRTDRTAWDAALGR